MLDHAAAEEESDRRVASQDARSGTRTGERESGGAAAVLGLQRSAGNAATARLIQAKLMVGDAADPLEREADEVAERAVAALQGSPVADGPVNISSAPATVARATSDGPGVGPSGGAAPATAEDAIRQAGSGRPLPDAVQRKVGDALGADLSGVRVHTGRASDQAAKELGAVAFTRGTDVHFAQGQYDPDSSAGQHLLGHELTHVVQQRGGDVVQRKTTKTSETKVQHDEYGSTTTKESGVKKGVGSSKESSTDTFDGTTQKTTESKTEAFAGAEAAVKVISRSTPTEITKAVEAMARAGAFGEASKKAAVERGPMRASAEGSAKGGAGAEASMKASATISPDLYHALLAVIEASASVGVSGELQGKVEAALGPLAVQVSAQLKAFAGAMASVKGSLDVGIDHVYATLEAEAFAGARAEGGADVTLKLGDAEATAGIEGKAMAGAVAEAKGEFKIDLTGVEISGKAEAFAGVKASATGKAELKYKGRSIIKATGTVGVSAGIGGSAEAEFSFRGGKLKISGNLAATLGIGGEVGGSLEIDFYEMARMIEEVIVDFFLKKKEAINRASPDVERAVIIDQALAAKTFQKGYDTYLGDFNAYNAKKSKKGESGIKRERIQQILDKRWHANKDNWQFIEFDKGIISAAKDAFGSKLIHIDIQGGQIRSFQVQRTDEQEAHIKKQRMKKGAKF